MRGLIYKDFSLFYKGLDKRTLWIAGAVIVLLIWKIGALGGLLASIMLAMTIRMQNITSFLNDDKANWKSYQYSLPVSNVSVVASKYISILLTLVISVIGSIFLTSLSGMLAHSFDWTIVTLAVYMAVFIPLLYTGICLPLTYWFGVRTAQAMGMLFVFPICWMIKYFEDGLGLSFMPDTLASYLLVFAVGVTILWIVSFFLSTIGYAQQK